MAQSKTEVKGSKPIAGRDQKFAGRDIVEIAGMAVDVTVARPSSATSAAELQQSLERNRTSHARHEDLLIALLASGKRVEDTSVGSAIQNGAVAISSVKGLIQDIVHLGGQALFTPAESRPIPEMIESAIELGREERRLRKEEKQVAEAKKQREFKRAQMIYRWQWLAAIVFLLAILVASRRYFGDLTLWFSLDFSANPIESLVKSVALAAFALLVLGLLALLVITLLALAPQYEEQPAGRLWYIHSMGKQQGPFEEAQILKEIRSGAILHDTLACSKGLAGWRRILSFPEFSKLNPVYQVEHEAPPLPWSSNAV